MPLVTEAYDLCLGAVGTADEGCASSACRDSGDGVANRLAGSEAPLGGTLTVFWLLGASLALGLEPSDVELFRCVVSEVPTERMVFAAGAVLAPWLEDGR
jgi:hypothetical protein